jgi:formamidopyrimidine-DNA glycosylase
MPELPDITIYVEALRARALGEPILAIRITNPFVLRSFDPPIETAEGVAIRDVGRLGKRIVFDLGSRNEDPDALFLVIHLMIAGRLHWKDLPDGGAPRPRTGGKAALAALDFPRGTLLLTEAATKKRASIQLVKGSKALAALHAGGIEPLEADLAAFADALTAENHTLKRSLTDPRILSGIGNAYSDEILHAARLSPVRLTSMLTDEEIARLYHATRRILAAWIERLRADLASSPNGFPEKVTAFRPDMAAHGRYGKPCPDCGTPIQRIVHAENETNYCPRCQTGGRILADRALSRLLKGDWPRSIEELEEAGLPATPPSTRAGSSRSRRRSRT